jgi:hypothetical protein
MTANGFKGMVAISPVPITKLPTRFGKFFNFCNYSAHKVHDHSPALDSGFRRNDVSGQAFLTLVIPAKAGAIAI